MTLVYVDIPLFTPNSSVGVIYGNMEIEDVPGEGGTVAFDKPVFSVVALGVSEFLSHLVVEHVSPPVAGTTEVLLSLADITLVSRADALKVAEYLQNGFGLHFDEH